MANPTSLLGGDGVVWNSLGGTEGGNSAAAAHTQICSPIPTTISIAGDMPLADIGAMTQEHAGICLFAATNSQNYRAYDGCIQHWPHLVCYRY